MFSIAKFSIANRNPQLGLLIFALLAYFAASDLRAATAKPDHPAANIAPAQIEHWVIQLDNDRFDIRQRAQQQLEQTGKLAVEAVSKIATTGSLESSTRAINILLQWSEAKEHGLQFAALEKLAHLPNRPRESARATRLLANAREQSALETLTKLGARVDRDVQIRGTTNLQVVIGPQWQGGNEGLQQLAQVPHATTISLHVAPLDDSAVDFLVKLPQVRRVELYGTKFSAEAVAKLKQHLPDAAVVQRGGAMLGIRGNVEGVVPNSAAHKAGIKRGDRITEFNGKKVANFDALTERIAKQQPGDSVTLTVLRNNQPRQVKVTFDQWGTNTNTPVIQQGQVPRKIQLGLPPKNVVPAQRR